jgi:hypothetical protein
MVGEYVARCQTPASVTQSNPVRADRVRDHSEKGCVVTADALPWIRPDDVREAVSEWTGIPADELIAPGQRLSRMAAAVDLLSACLLDACDMSHREVADYIGRDRRTVSRRRGVPETEIVAVVNLARHIRDERF